MVSKSVPRGWRDTSANTVLTLKYKDLSSLPRTHEEKDVCVCLGGGHTGQSVFIIPVLER